MNVLGAWLGVKETIAQDKSINYLTSMFNFENGLFAKGIFSEKTFFKKCNWIGFITHIVFLNDSKAHK